MLRSSLTCETYHIRPGRHELNFLSVEVQTCKKINPNNRAIIIGASMGGLLAARVLADYYGEVTVVERDALPDAYEPRKGVPQGRHTHGLLARGREVLEQLFPGFTEEAVA